jgi:glucuronate isomerase
MVGGGRALSRPAALLMTPDHYLLRMLYSLGVPMEDMGVGKPVAARDSRAIFRIFAHIGTRFSARRRGCGWSTRYTR